MIAAFRVEIEFKSSIKHRNNQLMYNHGRGKYGPDNQSDPNPN